jgi:HlyD family secretion protein
MHRLLAPLAAFALIPALSACDRVGSTQEAAATAVPTLPAITASREVVADGHVVPIRQATLSFMAAGRIAKILAAEGQAIKAGAVIVRLDSAQEASRVLQCEADLAAAWAQFEQLQAGASAQEIAGAEAGLAAARAQVQTAQGALSAATAALQKLESGARSEELAIGERQVEEAKNALWGAQARRDTICGRVPKYADQADCDTARAAVQEAEEQVRIAELGLELLASGPRSEDQRAALAAVQEARGQVAAAQAGSEQAQASLDQLRAGATAPEMDAARARIDQASAALEQARLQMDDTELRAPFDGTVAWLSANIGEVVSPGTPVARLADLSEWRIETEDLTELNVVGIEPGDAATLTFDALPGLELEGRVERIGKLGADRLGDIVYTVVLEPQEQDARLRWNMTSVVTIATANGST